jgi:threonylcarbamoyladenosine tRNA methylthiotransferase MtaB
VNNNKTIAFQTFGCKLNFAETSTISKSFIEKDYNKVSFKDKADIYVINSCTVTDNAEKRCRDAIKKAKKLNPDAKIALIGCYAQLRPDELESFGNIDFVLGNQEKFNLIKHVENSSKSCFTSNEDILKVKDFSPAYSIDDRTRTFLKIQDGCDYYCTFCAIPFARGKSRSDTIANTIKQAEEIAKLGQKEIILTGVNIGTFGKDHDENFLGLIKALEQVDGIERIRISSIEPNLLTDEIIDHVAQSTTILPHFHIPLQSGSNEMLNLMKRKYKREVFESRVLRIKEKMPLACIAADVIIGSPGETEDLFMETYQFIDSLNLSYLHVFTYSDRPEAKANKMANKVDGRDKKDRSRRLHDLGEKKKRDFYKINTETEHIVLWEGANKKGMMSGLTDNYIPVFRNYLEEKINTLEKIKLNNLNANGEWEV